MQVSIIDWEVRINMYEYIAHLSKEEQIELLNYMKINSDFFQIFMEMFAWDYTINNPEYWTSLRYEWRKQMLNMAVQKFSEDIGHLDIINDLERKYRQHHSNERLYWHIYHDAPEYIKDYFNWNSVFKSEHDYREEWEEFKQEIIDTILKH